MRESLLEKMKDYLKDTYPEEDMLANWIKELQEIEE